MDFPKGVIGLIGDSGSGVSEILRQANGAVTFDYTVDGEDAFGRLQAEAEMERQRKSGATVVIASHNEQLLRKIADEVWWVRDHQVVLQGDPADVLARYAQHTAERARATASVGQELAPSLRRGDGRAEIVSLATLDSSGNPSAFWRSGEAASIAVTVRFAKAVEDPVVGIMIRTRIGFEVYGTNTELERVQVGPCAAGDVRVITFSFQCDLCPQYYTITAASHDPNGVWHDWMEDAVAVTVTDSRYTAGVANLRARVTCSRG